jgi:hypothetical protein|tara:strand:+ start:6041 stop:6433 length:393 start_codon:yes stop_codon:yes gene_type:complete
MMAPLTDDNFIIYAIKNYSNPSFESMSDFEEDLQRIKYLKRLFGRYKQKGVLKHRLILNHIIILQNIFGALPTSRMLFHKLDPDTFAYLKTFLDYLSYLPEDETLVPEVRLSEIPSDLNIFRILQGLSDE